MHYIALLLCLLLASCSAPGYTIQTDGSRTGAPRQEPMAVWGTVPAITGAASTWLQKHGVTVIERVRLDHIFQEQRLQLISANEREGDVLRAGRLAGVKVIVFADGVVRPGRFGNATVTVRAVDVETAVVRWSGNAQYTGPLAYLEYAVTGLTCEALATAWGYRLPGTHVLAVQEYCQTP